MPRDERQSRGHAKWTEERDRGERDSLEEEDNYETCASSPVVAKASLASATEVTFLSNDDHDSEVSGRLISFVSILVSDLRPSFSDPN